MASEVKRYTVKGEWSDPPFLTIGSAVMVMDGDYSTLRTTAIELAKALDNCVQVIELIPGGPLMKRVTNESRVMLAKAREAGLL